MLTWFPVGMEACMLRIRAPWQQPGLGIMLALVAGLCTVLTVARPSAAGWYAALFIGGTAMVAARMAVTRIEITDVVVRYSEGWRGARREVARDQVRVIRRYPTKIVFGGPDGKHSMSVGGHWTMKQLMQIAQVLGVPLFDHRRWLGTRSVKTGRPVAVGEAPVVGQPS
jgi:hypothetical protein